MVDVHGQGPWSAQLAVLVVLQRLLEGYTSGEQFPMSDLKVGEATWLAARDVIACWSYIELALWLLEGWHQADSLWCAGVHCCAHTGALPCAQSSTRVRLPACVWVNLRRGAAELSRGDNLVRSALLHSCAIMP